MRLASFQSAVLVVVSLVSSLVVSAQTSVLTSAQVTEFEAFVRQQMAADKVPGISVGFIKDGVMWTKGYGFADLENRSPAKSESIYRMASVNKPMTAVAVLQLAEKGKIDLDAEVQTYVPYFPKKKFPVTVRQLLGHIGGISIIRITTRKDISRTARIREKQLLFLRISTLLTNPGRVIRIAATGTICSVPSSKGLRNAIRQIHDGECMEAARNGDDGDGQSI